MGSFCRCFAGILVAFWSHFPFVASHFPPPKWDPILSFSHTTVFFTTWLLQEASAHQLSVMMSIFKCKLLANNLSFLQNIEFGGIYPHSRATGSWVQENISLKNLQKNRIYKNSEFKPSTYLREVNTRGCCFTCANLILDTFHRWWHCMTEIISHASQRIFFDRFGHLGVLLSMHQH